MHDDLSVGFIEATCQAVSLQIAEGSRDFLSNTRQN